MKRLIGALSLFFSISFIGAMDKANISSEYPSCMAIMATKTWMWYSTGRFEEHPDTTITSDMIKKMYLWCHGERRIKLETMLSIEKVEELVQRNKVQAVELHFFEPSKKVGSLLRQSIDQ